jgi:hypothetical protein
MTSCAIADIPVGDLPWRNGKNSGNAPYLQILVIELRHNSIERSRFAD